MSMQGALDSSDEHLRALGELTAGFSLLHHQLAFTTWQLIALGGLLDQRVHKILTVGLSFRQLVDTFCALYRHYFGEVSDEMARLDSVRKRLEQAEADRNRLTHGIWAAGTTARTRTLIKEAARAKPGLKMDTEEFSAHDLAATAEELRVLANDVLSDFFLRHALSSKEAAEANEDRAPDRGGEDWRPQGD